MDATADADSQAPNVDAMAVEEGLSSKEGEGEGGGMEGGEKAEGGVTAEEGGEEGESCQNNSSNNEVEAATEAVTGGEGRIGEEQKAYAEAEGAAEEAARAAAATAAVEAAAEAPPAHAHAELPRYPRADEKQEDEYEDEESPTDSEGSDSPASELHLGSPSASPHGGAAGASNCLGDDENSQQQQQDVAGSSNSSNSHNNHSNNNSSNNNNNNSSTANTSTGNGEKSSNSRTVGGAPAVPGTAAGGQEFPPVFLPQRALPKRKEKELIRSWRSLPDMEILFTFDDFLYHSEHRDFIKAKMSFSRISASLSTENCDALIPPCLEVLEFSNQYIRTDTLLCLFHMALGCTVGELPADKLAARMRANAAILARHDTMPMLIKSLDFLLGQDPTSQQFDNGIMEREFRLIFNVIYLQILFNEHDEEFVRSLDRSQGKLSKSLVELLFEATKASSDNVRIPIKKVVLVLLRVLQCTLRISDRLLMPEVGPTQPRGDLEPNSLPANRFGNEEKNEPPMANPMTLEDGSGPPRLREFQAFTALQLHQRAMQVKYSSRNMPSAIEEGLKIIDSYKDDFLCNYPFHPAEVAFLKNTGFLKEAHSRYEDFDAKGLTKKPASKKVAKKAPNLPKYETSGPVEAATNGEEPPGAAVAGLGSFTDKPKPAPEEGHPSDSEHSESYGGTSGAESEASTTVTENQDFSPTAVFQRLYLSLFPRLTETLVLLLRLLLTSCSNVENYPGVVDLLHERHAVYLGEDMSAPSDSVQGHPLSAAADAQRHREILAAGVSGLLLVLLKVAKRTSAEQFASLAQLVTDSNGALVVLKFLNQDLSTAMDERDSQPVMSGLCYLPSGTTLPPSWLACATLRLVGVLYMLCKDSPERVRKYLIHYKAPFILRRLHRIENPHMQKLILKLLKKQVRYLPRKWKQGNMKAISAIYSSVSMSPLEDWLLTEPLGDPSTEGPSHAQVRASNIMYNSALVKGTFSANANSSLSSSISNDLLGGDAGVSVPNGANNNGSNTNNSNNHNSLGLGTPGGGPTNAIASPNCGGTGVGGGASGSGCAQTPSLATPAPNLPNAGNCGGGGMGCVGGGDIINNSNSNSGNASRGQPYGKTSTSNRWVRERGRSGQGLNSNIPSVDRRTGMGAAPLLPAPGYAQLFSEFVPDLHKINGLRS